MNDNLTTSSTAPLSRRTARLLTLPLLFLGVELWLNLGTYGHWFIVGRIPWRTLLLLVGPVAAFVPPVRRRFDSLWTRLAKPAWSIRLAIAIFISLIAPFLIAWTEHFEHILIEPTFHDEFSYLIQARMLEHLRLWMPPHPCGQFFDSFYLLVRPVYASMYFPGSAMFYVVPLWLGLPYVCGPLAMAGLSAGMVYLVFTEILDGASALLAVALLLSHHVFRIQAIMEMSHIPALFLGMVMILAYLNWRKNSRPAWAILLGAAAGWNAITRPADAFCFALVIGLAMLMDLWHKPRKIWLNTFATLILAALPFLALQLIVNRNVTGQWLRTPFTFYTQQFYPSAQFGFHPHPPKNLHVSDIPQKQMVYHNWALIMVWQHEWSNVTDIFLEYRLMFFAQRQLPDAFLWILLPLGLLSLHHRQLWTVWGVWPVFLIVYTGYAFMLPHYVITILPPAILFVVLSIRTLSDLFPSQRAMIRTALTGLILVFCAGSWPQVDRFVHDRYVDVPELEHINAVLSEQVTAPAVVLFHFNPANNPYQEPVYNTDVAWPDDAPVIRAQDLNPDVSAIGAPSDRDKPLYSYYANLDPTRVFYLYDRTDGTGKLTRLGTAKDLSTNQ